MDNRCQSAQSFGAHGDREDMTMKSRINTVLGFTLAVVMFAAAASAQQAPSPPPPTPYGAPIGLEAAKKVMAAAEAEATKNNWAMAIIILDSTGHPVMLHKFDNTQYGSIGAAEDKARSALYYRRPTKVFEDLVAQGGIGLRTLALRNASPLEGGIPLIVDGKIIGAIGVSGALSSQDGQVAKSGGEAAKSSRPSRKIIQGHTSPASLISLGLSPKKGRGPFFSMAINRSRDALHMHRHC